MFITKLSFYLANVKTTAIFRNSINQGDILRLNRFCRSVRKINPCFIKNVMFLIKFLPCKS